jgi:diguanylate cyclase (GGDEF)-like protein
MMAPRTHWTLGIFAFAIVLILAAGIVLASTNRQLLDLRRRTKESDVRADSLILLNLDVVNAETGQRGYLITQRIEFLEPYTSSLSHIQRLMSDIDQWAVGEGNLQNEWIEAKKDILLRLQQLKSTIVLERASGFASARDSLLDRSGATTMARIRSEIGQMISIETQLRDSDQAQADRLGSALFAYWGAFGGVAVLILVLAYLRLLADSRTQSSLMNRLTFTASHDPLTGLPNRAYFEEWLKKGLARARRTHERLAVLFIDLDGFKNVNDTLGHKAGDRVLSAVAESSRRALREADLIARLGGDEFAVAAVVANPAEDCRLLAERILKSLRPAPIPELHRDSISASIGIAVFPDDAENGEALIALADQAMYSVKTHGKSGYQFSLREPGA